MTYTLESLIKEELKVFQKLDKTLQNPFTSKEIVEGIAHDYDEILEKCFSFPIESYAQFALKCDFIFTFIERDYDNTLQLSRMRNAISSDIKQLKKTA